MNSSIMAVLKDNKKAQFILPLTGLGLLGGGFLQKGSSSFLNDLSNEDHSHLFEI